MTTGGPAAGLQLWVQRNKQPNTDILSLINSINYEVDKANMLMLLMFVMQTIDYSSLADTILAFTWSHVCVDLVNVRQMFILNFQL